MGRFDYSFPFSAVVGQDAIKRGMILNAVNPRIGGILISGEKGTAKSTLARGLARLLGGAPFVELPLNVTEDRLVGTLDIERTVHSGRRSFEPGLLQAADGGFLYADEVNLLPAHIVNALLEVSASGVNRVEREGLSRSHRADFVLIGTMNPEEGTLRPQLLDRFGLYVRAEGERSLETRCEILLRRLAYERDPAAFCQAWQGEDERLAGEIRSARKRLPAVVLPDRQLAFAAALAREGGCAGHRAELALCETARAAAALRGAGAVSREDLEAAAPLALPHRLREAVSVEQVSRAAPPEESRPSKMPDAPESPPDAAPTDGDGAEPLAPEDGGSPPSSPPEGPPEDGPGADNGTVAPADITVRITERRGDAGAGTGKRSKVRSHTAQGRYVRSRTRREKNNDIAVDATLRAAAVHSAVAVPEAGDGLRLQVREEDLREKIRERRTGMTILFLVDASGSMGARRRLGAVRGAVLSMLSDAYQKRDQVGIIAFRGRGAEVILPITRSVDLAEKKLMHLSTGGRTPLAAGLYRAFELLKVHRLRSPEAARLLVLVTDGRANVPEGDAAVELALAAGRKLAAEGVRSIVLDTESGFARFALARQLAETMAAEYIPLTHVTRGEIERNLETYLR